MGTWGHKPLENDSAADFAGNFNDSKDISILERAFDKVNALKAEQYLEAPEAEEAVAATKIVRDLSPDQIKEEDRNRLIEKSKSALRRILESSELKELWLESDEYKNWVTSVEALIK